MTKPALAPRPKNGENDGIDIESIFNAMATAIVVVDADGQVREVNPVAESLAHGADVPVGRSFMEVFLAEADRAI